MFIIVFYDSTCMDKSSSAEVADYKGADTLSTCLRFYRVDHVVMKNGECINAFRFTDKGFDAVTDVFSKGW